MVIPQVIVLLLLLLCICVWGYSTMIIRENHHWILHRCLPPCPIVQQRRRYLLPAVWAGQRRWRRHRHRATGIGMLPTSSAHSKQGEQTTKNASVSPVIPLFVQKYAVTGHYRRNETRSVASQTEYQSQKTGRSVCTAYPCSVYGAGELDEAQEDRPGGQFTLRIWDGEAQSIRYFNLTWKWRTLRCALAISKRVEADEIVLRHDGEDVDDRMLIPQPRLGGSLRWRWRCGVCTQLLIHLGRGVVLAPDSVMLEYRRGRLRIYQRLLHGRTSPPLSWRWQQCRCMDISYEGSA